jgi:RNA polymerase sigma factor (sigma-70 family)
MDEPLGPLLQRIAARDPQALAELYKLSVTRAYAVAFRITRVHEAAEEVVADAYLQVWNTVDRFDGERGNVIAWLLMITRSRALDYLRRQDAPTFSLEPEWLEEALAADAAGDPLEVLSTARSSERIHAALEILPAVERQLIGLAFLRGLTHHEIAQMSRLPLGTVKTHIRRGLLAMRALLDEEIGAGQGVFPNGH